MKPSFGNNMDHTKRNIQIIDQVKTTPDQKGDKTDLILFYGLDEKIIVIGCV